MLLACDSQGKEFQKRLATLTGNSKPKPEELEEIKELNKEIPEIKTKIAELDKQLTDISTEHGTIRKEGLTVVAERKKLDADIVTIKTVDIPALETALAQSEKDIEMLKDNIKENEIIVRDTEKENKQKIKEYQDTFNIMNKNRYQVTQDPNETDTDFIKRIKSLETMTFDKNIIKDRAATEGNKKFMKNLKDITEMQFAMYLS
jgi:predicted  nucleic acid-binding Zn-ribbon protein